MKKIISLIVMLFFSVAVHSATSITENDYTFTPSGSYIDILDVNANGSSIDVAFLGQDSATNQPLILIKDAADDSFIRYITIFDSDWDVVWDLKKLDDSNSNYYPELSVKAENPTTGEVKVQIVDSYTGLDVNSLVFVSAQAPSTSVVNDGFESYADSSSLNGGAGGTGWTSGWTGDANFTVVSTDTPNEGVQHVKFTPTVDAFITISRTFTSINTGILYVDVKINRTGGTSGKPIRGDVNLYSGTTQLTRIFMYYSDTANTINLIHWDGSANAWLTVGSMPNDSYITLGIQIDQTNQQNKYRMNVDGGSWSSWVTMISNPSFTGMDKIELTVSNQDGQASGSMYFDNISFT